VFSQEYIRQIIWAVSGLVIFIFISVFDYRRIERLSPYVYIVLILLLVITLFFGKVVNGARSWLGPSGIGIQPSEFAKVTTIIFLAYYLERVGRRIRDLRYFAASFLICLLPVFLILLQPDLGSAIVYIPILLFMTFTAGAKLRYLCFVITAGMLMMIFTVLPAWQQEIVGEEVLFVQIFTGRELIIYPVITLVLVVAFSSAGYLLTKKSYLYWIIYGSSIFLVSLLGAVAARRVIQDYQIMRLIVFLNPEVDPRGAGWNIIQSQTAIGSGGVLGKGFLQGTQSHYRYLPQQSTDFIFSIMAEEWGFVGAIAVFSLFGIILIRGLYIVSIAKDRFAVYIGSGVLGMIFFHFMINIGMAMGIMPVTGIPLFFLSYGGSSLWTALIGVGLIMSIYQHRYQY
jgi:rod shape determining protein RodA